MCVYGLYDSADVEDAGCEDERPTSTKFRGKEPDEETREEGYTSNELDKRTLRYDQSLPPAWSRLVELEPTEARCLFV
jgi:hypothetical protein